jgi:hypothetical protein
MEVEDAMLDNVDGVGDELPVEEELLVVNEPTLDADAILARERNRATRKVAKERLEVSMAKLTRDWKNTT